MNTYSKMLPIIDSTDYENHFWNALRGKKGHKEHLEKGVESNTGAYMMTTKGQNKFTTAIKNESIFRNIATAVQVFDHDYRIKTVGVNDVSAWVAEGGAIPISDGMEDFGEVTLSTHKLAVFLKLEETLVRDPFFKIEDYLVKRLAKNFGKAEDYGFIRGTGVNMPTGILADEGGAEIGVTTKALTYDDVVKLFFSVKPEYRKNGVWMMNDETALTLRTLKDADGNYVWDHSTGTIFGKKVVINEYMPAIAVGNKPIAFGDFSFYDIVERADASVRIIKETLPKVDDVGYIAYEFLDGKLIRPEAIKVLQMV